MFTISKYFLKSTRLGVKTIVISRDIIFCKNIKSKKHIFHTALGICDFFSYVISLLIISCHLITSKQYVR